MRIGVLFPQLELGADPVAAVEMAVVAESLGYTHLVAYEHVTGVDPRGDPRRTSRYTHTASFLEPFALFGFVAAVTKTLELATGVMVLPARPTALVAKQAATVDVLSRGRLRLGFGIGSNRLEFAALGARFDDRAARFEEQIDVLRRLWIDPVTDYHGRWHDLDGVGINPLPTQRPIPLWLGGSSDTAIARAARLGDGWFAQIDATEDPARKVRAFHEHLVEAGRDPHRVGVEWRLDAGAGDPLSWADRAASLQDLGFTHLHLNTMGAGRRSIPEHLDALAKFRRAADPLFKAAVGVDREAERSRE